MNKERIKELGLSDEDYLKYANEYKKIFEGILESKVHLSNYDRTLEASELGFGSINRKIELNSGLDEFLNLKYIWILNNFYIEKLSKEQLAILISGTEEAKQSLVLSTYKDIILTNYHRGEYINQRYKINLTDSTSLNDFSFNDELVLGIFFGENKVKSNTKEDYLNLYEKKKDYLKRFNNQLITEIKNNLGIETKIINR